VLRGGLSHAWEPTFQRVHEAYAAAEVYSESLESGFSEGTSRNKRRGL
jgi:hypothetical protein